jgi:hypothetical protein
MSAPTRTTRPPLILGAPLVQPNGYPHPNAVAVFNGINTVVADGPVTQDTSANFPANYPPGEYSQMMGYQTDTGALFLSVQIAGVWTWVMIMSGTAPTQTYTPYTFLPGLPGPGQCVLQWPCPGPTLFPSGVTFPANIPDFAGALQVLPTATAVYSLYKIPAGTVIGTTAGAGTQFGTMTISTAGVFTISSSAETFVWKQVFALWAPSTQDNTLAGVSALFPGTH